MDQDLGIIQDQHEILLPILLMMLGVYNMFNHVLFLDHQSYGFNPHGNLRIHVVEDVSDHHHHHHHHHKIGLILLTSAGQDHEEFE